MCHWLQELKNVYRQTETNCASNTVQITIFLLWRLMPWCICSGSLLLTTRFCIVFKTALFTVVTLIHLHRQYISPFLFSRTLTSSKPVYYRWSSFRWTDKCYRISFCHHIVREYNLKRIHRWSPRVCIPVYTLKSYSNRNKVQSTTNNNIEWQIIYSTHWCANV